MFESNAKRQLERREAIPGEDLENAQWDSERNEALEELDKDMIGDFHQLERVISRMPTGNSRFRAHALLWLLRWNQKVNVDATKCAQTLKGILNQTAPQALKHEIDEG